MYLFFCIFRMFWVYTNLIFFLLKNNKLFFNFYFINNFNSVFFIFINNYNWKPFKLLNTPQSVLNIKHPSFNFKNLFLIKFLKFFNNLFKMKYNLFQFDQINYYGNYNNHNLYYFNYKNMFYYKTLINTLYDLSYNNYNFIILDNNYKNIFPLYNFIYSSKNINTHKKYFFVNSKYFTYKNWLYFYNNFILKFNISLILIFDFFHFNKFFQSLVLTNLPISALIPVNYDNIFIDYPVYLSSLPNFFEKFIFLNLITQIYLTSYNFRNYNYKIRYLKMFYNFYTKTHLV